MRTLTHSPRHSATPGRSTGASSRTTSGTPSLEFFQGAWDHSLIPNGIVVNGDEVVAGKSRVKITLEPGFVEVSGWVLQACRGEQLHWKETDGGEKCVWTRKHVAPKRQRTPSAKQMAAVTDGDMIEHWLKHPLMRKAAPQTPKRQTPKSPDTEDILQMLEDMGGNRKAKPEQESESESESEPIKVSEAELRRYTKALLRKERATEKRIMKKSKDDRG